jgi:hypothetical protein
MLSAAMLPISVSDMEEAGGDSVFVCFSSHSRRCCCVVSVGRQLMRSEAYRETRGRVMDLKRDECDVVTTVVLSLLTVTEDEDDREKKVDVDDDGAEDGAGGGRMMVEGARAKASDRGGLLRAGEESGVEESEE